MRILLISSASAMALGVTAAGAQTPTETRGFYIGGGYQYVDLETDTEFETVDDIGDSVNAVALRAGYQFTDFFSVEVEASFGIDEGDFDFEGEEDDLGLDLDSDDSGADLGETVLASGSGDLEMDFLFGAFARGQYPVTDRLDVFARVGYAYIEAEANGSVDGDPDESITLARGDDSGVAFGAGITFDLTESWQVRADYTRYEFDDVDANSGLIFLEYKFDGFGRYR